MKIRNLYLLFVAGILTCGATSCLYEDKGNYDYHDINDIVIEGINTVEAYSAVSFIDTLRIEPQITCALREDEKNLEYKWVILTPYGQEEERVVGTDKNLVYPVDLKADKYTCLFKVYDKVGDLIWTKPFSLAVSSITSEGWLILCEQEHKTRMDIIHTVDKERNMIGREVFDGGDLAGEPIGLDYTSGLLGRLMLHSTKSSLVLNSEDLSVGEESDMRYEFGIPPARVDARKVEYTTTRNDNIYLLIDQAGDLYVKRERNELYAFRANHLSGDDRYFRLAPFIGVRKTKDWRSKDHSVVLYDDTNLRFLEIPGGAFLPRVMQYEKTDLWPSAVTGKEMVYMESNLNATFALMKDPGETGGRVWLYGMELNADSRNVQKYYQEVQGEGIEKASGFAFHSLYPYLFYAVGGDVYRYDYSMKMPAQKVLSFPDATVCKLCFPVYLGWIAYEEWEKERQYDLVIGYNDHRKASHKSGNICIYKVPALRGDLELKGRYTDLGHIIDFVYKERN